MQNVSSKTKQLTGTAVLIAIIILLQTMLGSIQIGPFTITLTLVPIIIGAVLYGPLTGAFLGLVFGVIVSIQVVTGAAGAGSTMMLEMNPVATILAPIVNTGIFIVALVTIFGPLAKQWAEAAGSASVASYILAGIIGVNFVVELAADVILAPIIMRIVCAIREN